MHVIINKNGEDVRIKFLGDFNVQLSRSDNLYKYKGFNAHSCLLRDFIVGNEISLVDFIF